MADRVDEKTEGGANGGGPRYVITPLVEELLTAVQVTCRPQAEGWQEALAERLTALMYGPFVANSEIKADALNVISARLRAVERELAPGAQTARGMKYEISNFGGQS